MMKKLYEKSQLTFALVWIGIYCVGMSVFAGSGVCRCIVQDTAQKRTYLN